MLNENGEKIMRTRCWMSVNKDPYLSKVARRRILCCEGLYYSAYIEFSSSVARIRLRRMDRVFGKPGFTPPCVSFKRKGKFAFFRFSGAALREAPGNDAKRETNSRNWPFAFARKPRLISVKLMFCLKILTTGGKRPNHFQFWLTPFALPLSIDSWSITYCSRIIIRTAFWQRSWKDYNFFTKPVFTRRRKIVPGLSARYWLL